jgi:dTDP-4-dehydrorhamnose 3,5-epimerase-like enzyme
MNKEKENLWQGINDEARSALGMRDYSAGTVAEQLSRKGVEARRLIAADRNDAEVKKAWIPGVEIFSRTIYPQRHRGAFGELARRDEGVLAKIGFWPDQWSAARMFAMTAKGFHVHPPSIPDGTSASDWMQRLFLNEATDYSLRRYTEEQWDLMFVVQGVAEMILRDVRAGLPIRTMRFLIDGDNHRSGDNVAVVIPPGVAHAIRTEGSEDLVMIYGTSTSFRPEFEGRMASDVESAPLPDTWQKFLSKGD